MSLPDVVSREDWLAARRRLLAQEKELTRRHDQLNADRRRLPMVKVEKNYTFDGPNGPVTLKQLFGDRRQLIVQHVMLGPDWDQPCPGCSAALDELSAGVLNHLGSRETAFVLVSRAPYDKIAATAKERGWDVPWYSSYGSDFNYDYQVTLDESVGQLQYNYRPEPDLLGGERSTEMPGYSAFLREGEDFVTAGTVPEPPEVGSLVPTAPSPATISRRGVLGFAGAGSVLLIALSVGQSIGGPLRRTALLAPHGQVTGSGPLDFQINVTAAEGGVKPEETGSSWRLTLSCEEPSTTAPVTLTRAQLLAMPQHTASLAINCVEGWSTGNQVWTGVRLRDLARLAGADNPGAVLVQSLQQHGGHATLSAGQIMNPDSLLAFRVNGVELSADHGYPARVILPASPGVHNIKWVTTMTFRS